MFSNLPRVAKRWAKHTPDMDKLPEKVESSEKKAFIKGFAETLQKTAFDDQADMRDFSPGEFGTDPFGNAPSLLPADNFRSFLQVMQSIHSDPNLSSEEKNRLIWKLEQRPKISPPGESSLGKLLGAGLGAVALSGLNNYLFMNNMDKSQMSPLVQKLISLGALGFGGYLGYQHGGRLLSLEPRIVDLRRTPEQEMYSPYKASF